jgi:hypothetical protein
LVDAALSQFKERVFDKRKKEFTGAILQEIYKNRENEIVDQNLIKDAINQFIYMGYEKKITVKKVDNEISWTGEINLMLYDKEFEVPLKDATRKYFMKKAEIWAENDSCHEYILKVAQHLKKEEQICDFMMQVETKGKIISIIEQELIEKKAQAVILKEATGCKFMFNERKVDQLTIMYKVFSRVETTLKCIIEQMNPYIMQEGTKIVSNKEHLKDPIKFTELLLDFKKQMDELIQEAFNNDLKFQKARDQSFQNFMNTCPSTPYNIALYTDSEFKKGLKQLSDIQIDSRLSAIVRLFCCLHGRDTFIHSYTNFLSLRLLNKSSVSDQAEELMI